MAQYRTAQGRTVDMSTLAAKNEKTRAVGNMKVNARGDLLDESGRVISPRADQVGHAYNNQVQRKQD